MGADTICIKDMANLLLPYSAYSLVKKLKKSVKAPIHLHTHNTSGTGDMTLLKAIEAGVDIVDTALSPMGKRHQPAGHRAAGGHVAGHALRHRPVPGADERGRQALPRRG